MSRETVSPATPDLEVVPSDEVEEGWAALEVQVQNPEAGAGHDSTSESTSPETTSGSEESETPLTYDQAYTKIVKAVEQARIAATPEDPDVSTSRALTEETHNKVESERSEAQKALSRHFKHNESGEKFRVRFSRLVGGELSTPVEGTLTDIGNFDYYARDFLVDVRCKVNGVEELHRGQFSRQVLPVQ